MPALTPRARLTLLILLAGLVVGTLTPARRLADASTYVLATASLYHDRDLTYSPLDLARAQTMQFDDLPNGLFLVKRETGYVYGKPFLYSLAALPFYALLGIRGFMALNGVLLAALVLLGADILSHRLAWRQALLASSVVFGFTVTPAYLFWIDPFLLASVLVAAAAAACRRDRPLLAGAALALLASVRAPYALVAVGPAALYLFGGRWRSLAQFGAAMLLVGGLLLGFETVRTGRWATYTAQRLYYASTFPYQRGLYEDEVGTPRVLDPTAARWPGAIELARRNAYFVVGRFAGVFVYFPTLLVCLLWSRRWDREKWLWLAALALASEALLFAIPGNPFGGSHALGNRLFVLLPIALTWIEAVRPSRWRLAATAVLLALAVPLVERPFELSLHPGRQMIEIPYRWLPFEWPNTPSINFPFVLGDMRALTDNQYYWEDGAVWTRGGTTADFALCRKRGEPPRFRFWSPLPRAEILDGDVRLSLEWQAGRDIEVTLSHPVAHNPGRADCDVYRLRVATDGGVAASSLGRRDDNRFIGVRVRPLANSPAAP